MTTAACAAAFIGSMFSKSSNVALGVGTTVDENHLLEKPRQQPASGQDGSGSDSSGAQ